MKRNWNAIRQISCRPTQIALATCSDSEVLPRIQQAFPECFEDGEETIIGTWSWIKQEWERHAHSDYSAHEARHCLFTNWGEAVPMVYHLFFGRYDVKDGYYKDGPIPTDLLDQLKNVVWDDEGKSPLAPIVSQYQGSEWVVARMGTSTNGLGALPYEGGDDSEGELMIVPKNHIIFDL